MIVAEWWDNSEELSFLDAEIVSCRACPRLVAWREEAAANPPARFAGQEYWAKPLPGFGDPDAKIFMIGLAPSAHGSNRTGRMFTGDKSGDFLYAALYRAGFANQPESIDRFDGLTLKGIRISAPVRCAPPENKPTPAERDRCVPYLWRELELVQPKVIIPMGGFGWQVALRILADLGFVGPAQSPKFTHGAEVLFKRPGHQIGPAGAVVSALPNLGRNSVVSRQRLSALPQPTEELSIRPALNDGDLAAAPRFPEVREWSGPVTLLGCFHPSPQNVNTGRLTPEMLDTLLARAKALSVETPVG